MKMFVYNLHMELLMGTKEHTFEGRVGISLSRLNLGKGVPIKKRKFGKGV
jgi:hypothetical protein